MEKHMEDCVNKVLHRALYKEGFLNNIVVVGE